MPNTNWDEVTSFFNGVIIESKEIDRLAPDGTGDLKVAVYSKDFDQTLTITIPASRVEDFMKQLQLFDAQIHQGTFPIADERDKHEEVVLDEYQEYVTSQRNAIMPAMSRASFYSRKARLERGDTMTQREFDNRNNQKKTHWNVGDHVVINSDGYIVTHIEDLEDVWHIRLDRKHSLPIYWRVPK